MKQPAVYVNFIEDMSIVSYADGAVRPFIVTPKKYFGLGLNLGKLIVGLRIKNPTAGLVIITKAQWSLDGQTWQDVAGEVISAKSAAGDYIGELESDSLPPYLRIYVEVGHSNTPPQPQVGAEITMWGYYKFRT